MKKLSAKQVQDTQLKGPRLGSGQAEPVWQAASFLAVGEAILVEQSEWPYKAAPTPSMMPKRYRKEGATYRVNTLADNSGWLIRRTA